MLYLVLAILSSAIISIIIRLSNGRIKNKMMMFLVNYAVCLICSIFFLGDVNSFNKDNIGFPIWFGCITGFLFLAGFLFLEFNIRKNGVVLSSTFARLGVLVPIFVSIVIFQEVPGVLKIIGIALAVIAIIVMNIKKRDENSKGFNALSLLLILLLLASGLSDSSSTIFKHVADSSLEGLYLMVVFAAALIFTLIVLLFKHEPISYKDVLFGIALGVPNYFSAFFLLNSLTSLPAVVVYPTYSVATIVVITIVGIIVFKERPKLQEIVGIILILAALVLLNV